MMLTWHKAAAMSIGDGSKLSGSCQILLPLKKHVPTLLQAGLLLAETEFALQVESDIAPYKGLLMGLFFMTVGMEISVGLFFAKWQTVLLGITILIVGKVITSTIAPVGLH